jgi:hypothetical protein
MRSCGTPLPRSREAIAKNKSYCEQKLEPIALQRAAVFLVTIGDKAAEFALYLSRHPSG